MFWGPGRLPRWLQNRILVDISPLRRHLGATCPQHGGQDGNLQATWPNLGRTAAVSEAVLGMSGEVLGGSGAALGSLWAISGRSWGHLGPVLAPSWAILGDLKRS